MGRCRRLVVLPHCLRLDSFKLEIMEIMEIMEIKMIEPTTGSSHCTGM